MLIKKKVGYILLEPCCHYSYMIFLNNNISISFELKLYSYTSPRCSKLWSNQSTNQVQVLDDSEKEELFYLQTEAQGEAAIRHVI